MEFLRIYIFLVFFSREGGMTKSAPFFTEVGGREGRYTLRCGGVFTIPAGGKVEAEKATSKVSLDGCECLRGAAQLKATVSSADSLEVKCWGYAAALRERKCS